ncbi:WD40/YVTN/BNR-like repeat-containing protein [Methylorubrum salsuginis]|uniref:BNR/Asp-box repeat-containing protein n=1 Tax=Methylorubrum salsuginis TaxID=414703 RepID=A0A1I4LS43_9HYPH|nr:hypothetical protein [Methylorubrum salsuginis]SFL93721.1 hypothetical protein SAMN04488125_13129 [Methylorubrum salsuginis]
MRRRDLLALAGAAVLRPDALRAGVGETRWRTLRIGAGGFLVGMDLAADGTAVVRTDTYGAWIREPQATGWRPLVTRASMPPEDRHEDSPATSWPLDVALAPSLTRRLYMGLDGWLYRSDDAGRSWARTAYPRVEGMGGVANESKVNGRKIAVDPHDPDTVYVGAPRDPLRVSHDGGRSWRSVTDVPVAGMLGDEAMGYLVIVDPTAPQWDGRASVVYACPWGAGVHRSLDGGATWSLLPGSPKGLRHAAIDPRGLLYAVGGTETDPARQLNRFDGRWSTLSPPDTGAEAWHSITASLHAPGRILAGKVDGSLCESLDGGRSWQSPIPRTALRRTAEDIPWLAWTDEVWMSNGDIRFDPARPDRLLFAQGIGMWEATFPPGARSVGWTSCSRNIEQLVATQCLHPPGADSAALLTCMDRGVWRVTDPDAYPARHGPDPAFTHCWGIDYASGDPTFLVATMSSQQASDRDRSGFSTDGGRTWRRFSRRPSWAEATSGKGFIAASTPANLVWMPGEGRGLPHYTRDGGATWRPCAVEGLGEADAGGFGAPIHIRRFALCADRMVPGTFYLVHHPAGLFASTDGGAYWTRRHAFRTQGRAWTDRFHAKLRAVPGQAGHLYYTAGHSSAERYGALRHSRDGGRTWDALGSVSEVSDFAFGKAATGSEIPALYIAGYVAARWGLHRSTDAGTTWAQLGDGFPTGSLDRIAALEADKAVFGRVYVGFAGSGWAYGSL